MCISRIILAILNIDEYRNMYIRYVCVRERERESRMTTNLWYDDMKKEYRSSSAWRHKIATKAIM